MPGSETALEELTCRVLGHLVQKGVVAKIADDLYCGGHTPEELLHNWERVLIALHKCSLNLSASKTIIAPKDATILGWHWHLGTIQASPHRIATLASCQPPKTVTALRSCIGSYKVLSRVIKNSSDLIAPLEDIIAGGNAKDTIAWNGELLAAFDSAQKALSTHKAISLPRPSDQLWIVTDGALRKLGLGATLYEGREGKPLLAGFFSAKLRPNQRQWLPSSLDRDRYLVAEVDPPWCNIRKFAGNQLRQTSYRVKYTDCCKVTSDYPEVTTKSTHSHADEDDQNPEDLQSDDVPHSPSLPAVPSATSEVPSPQQHTPIIAPNPAVDLTETPDNCGTEPAALPVDSEFNTEEPIPSDLPDRDTVVTRPSRRRTLPKKFDEFVMF
uniref:Reverse transcriptase/retrotransposon-derived protein RNase H-like domain-containing protein n=1 Tax=Magallana gigas TaxID=29159 RepID=A0A8W8NMM5_MAGGI